MRTAQVVAGLGLLAAATLGAAAGQGPGGAGKPWPVAPAALAPHAMEAVWQTELVVDPHRPVKAAWVAGEFVVALDAVNRAYVVSASTGVRLWSKQVAEPHETVWPPSADDGDLWMATTTTLWGFRGADGKEIGHTALDFAPAGRPAASAAFVFVPDAKGWLQAVSVGPAQIGFNEWAIGAVTSEAVLSQRVEGVEGRNGAPVGSQAREISVRGPGAAGWRGTSWGRWTSDCITAGPVVDGALVYFAGQNGHVYASAQNVRRIVWEFPTEGPIVADLKRTKSGLVLVGSLDYSVYALMGSSARLAWRFNAGEPIRGPLYAFESPVAAAPAEAPEAPAGKAAPAGGQVFLFTQESGLRALDASNGRPQWSLAEAVRLATADAENVYVTTRGGDLLAVSRTDGTVRFSVPMQPGTLVAVNETDTGVIYLLTPGGRVAAVARKKGV